MRPSVDAGLVYRFEQQKWRIYPSFGVGYVYHLRDRGFVKSSTGSDEVLHTVEYKQRASSLTLNMGVIGQLLFLFTQVLVSQHQLRAAFAEIKRGTGANGQRCRD
jgi:hypothetical protein